MKDTFVKLYQEHIKRDGAEELLDYIYGTDFFDAPASHRFHGAYVGGLVEHSVNVFKRLVAEPTDANMETIAIVALLHDICKANFYVSVKKSRKTGRTLPNGKPEWEDYFGYEIDDKCPYGHGEKSVWIISQFMKLTEEEAMAIRWHMGGFDESVKGGSYALSGAWSKYPLGVLLHCADLQASYLDENK